MLASNENIASKRSLDRVFECIGSDVDYINDGRQTDVNSGMYQYVTTLPDILQRSFPMTMHAMHESIPYYYKNYTRISDGLSDDALRVAEASLIVGALIGFHSHILTKPYDEFNEDDTQVSQQDISTVGYELIRRFTVEETRLFYSHSEKSWVYMLTYGATVAEDYEKPAHYLTDTIDTVKCAAKKAALVGFAIGQEIGIFLHDNSYTNLGSSAS